MIKITEMKITNITALLFLAFALLFTSCKSDSISDKITAAETAFQTEDYSAAQSLAAEITATDSLQLLGCNNLCRLSILFMQLSEVQNEEENVASATSCYRNALLLNPDSALSFYNSIPLENEGFVTVISELNKRYNIDTDSIIIDVQDYQELDSMEVQDGQE